MADRTRWLVLGISIVLLVMGGAVWAGTNGPLKALEITEVFLDYDQGLIFIYGTNIDKGDAPVVMLGDYPDPLHVIQYSEYEISAELPPDLAAGDYLLTVETGNPSHQFDSHDLTVGAVGPQGEPGPEGEPGILGPIGAQGPPGISGFGFVLVSFGRIVGVNDSMIVPVTCPPGETALSGAFTLMPSETSTWQDYNKFVFWTSQQNGSNQWIFVWKNTDSVAHDFQGVARAACAIVK